LFCDTNLHVSLRRQVLANLFLQNFFRHLLADCRCNVQLLLVLILIQQYRLPLILPLIRLSVQGVILNVRWYTGIKVAVSGSGIAVNYTRLRINKLLRVLRLRGGEICLRVQQRPSLRDRLGLNIQQKGSWSELFRECISRSFCYLKRVAWRGKRLLLSCGNYKFICISKILTNLSRTDAEASLIWYHCDSVEMHGRAET